MRVDGIDSKIVRCCPLHHVTVSRGCTKYIAHTLSGRTLAPKSLRASLNLLLLPLIATLTVIKVSGLTGGMDAIVSTDDDDDSAWDEALDLEARQVGVW